MKRRSKLLILLSSALLLGGTALALWKTGFFDALTSVDSLRSYIDESAPYSHLAFFLIQLLSVILGPIPSNLTASAGGVLFGFWPAFLLTFAAITLGSMLVFCLARLIGQPFADQLVSQNMSEKYLDLIQRKRDTFLILAFLFPLFPDDLLCILAGLSDLPAGRFFLMVVLARPWGLMVACAVGGSALSFPLWLLIPLALAGLVLFLVCMKYGDRWEAAILKKFGK